MSSQSLRLSPGAQALFAHCRDLKPAVGTISTNLNYMPYLEDGTSRMPARPVLAPYLAEYQALVEEELAEGMRRYPSDPQKALNAAITLATIAIMARMADRTAQPAGPYFTGRAKGSWTATLPGGRTMRSGTVMSAEQQRATLRARRAAARDSARARSKK